MKKKRALAALACMIGYLTAVPDSQATAVVATVKRLEATTTKKGDIHSVFEGGTWQGRRSPVPSSAQRLSDRITIEFAEDGVTLSGVNVDECKDHPLRSLISVTVVLSDLTSSEKLLPYECKISQCFSVRGAEASVKRVLIDFSDNQEACVSRIWFTSASPKAPVVAVRFKTRNH
jgi:hypothetical protein